MLCSVYFHLDTDVSGHPIGPETPVFTNHPCVKPPEEPRPRLHSGGSLKSRAKFLVFAFSPE
jgi:hypothetical protein